VRALRPVSVLHLAFAGLLVASSCAAPAPKPAPVPAAPPTPVPTPTPTPLPRGIDPADMDPSANACADFYEYADGGWLKKNPVPPEYSSWGAFNEVEERNREALRTILERVTADTAAAAGSEPRKLGDFYGACMDEAAIESAGIEPLRPEIEKIEAIRSRATLQAEVARLQLRGVNALFQFGSEQDRKNSSEVIAAAFQGGLGLPDRDYYTKTDDASKKIRDQYVEHVRKMFALAGDDPPRAQIEARLILTIETKLAEPSMTRVELRDPEATYHRMARAQLKNLTPGFSWIAFFRDLGAPGIAAVNVGQPKFFEALARTLKDVPLSDWKVYLRWRLLDTAASSLSSAFVNEDFDFNQRILEGTEQIQPRWKRCVRATDNALGFALGKLYVAERFPPESKARADEMVANLIAALRDDLATLSWMGPETRQAAIAKLDAFTPKIGYPEKWRDYSALAVTRGPHVVNVLNAADFESRRDLAKIGKPVDRTDWEMTPPTVNAYYAAPRNEIVFPAGILQPPFFDGKADDAVNYGAIGSIIGHEMTHGFDDEGRKFDGRGNLVNWWTPEDQKNFEERATCVEKQFDAYVVEGDLHENGKLVLGESIADLGGLSIALRAYERSRAGKPPVPPILGLTDLQRFFIGWARAWSTNDRPEFARLMVNVNPHPLDRFRAIAAPANLEEFARAFSCKPGDPMVRAEVCRIW
jgi:putative endopeptidase